MRWDMRNARMTTSNNPQTESPSEPISAFRAKIAPTSIFRLRDQNRWYMEMMGKEALARQIKLARDGKPRKSK